MPPNDQPAPSTAAMIRLPPRRYEDLETRRAAMTRAAKERAARPDEMKKPEAVGDAFSVPCAIDGAASRWPTTASPS